MLKKHRLKSKNPMPLLLFLFLPRAQKAEINFKLKKQRKPSPMKKGNHVGGIDFIKENFKNVLTTRQDRRQKVPSSPS